MEKQYNKFYDATAYLTGRYATDPNYGAKLNSLINTYNLTRLIRHQQVRLQQPQVQQQRLLRRLQRHHLQQQM